MKPILFNTEMVQAILDGRKSVTRRVVKPQPLEKLCYASMGYKHGTWAYASDEAWKSWGEEWRRERPLPDAEKARRWMPPCHTGDILYVRETWQEVYETEYDAENPNGFVNIRNFISNFDDIPKVEAGISSNESSEKMQPRMKYYVFKESDIKYADPKNALLWHPSVHMPKEAARLFLRVTGVRVERLHEVTTEGLQAEGGKKMRGNCTCAWHTETCKNKPCSNRDAFEFYRWLNPFIALWDSTIKKADIPLYGWAANPWVWVIKFERISKEEALKGSEMA